jgi:hypothetical protein
LLRPIHGYTALDITQWLQILKDYGPVVGILLGFIFWQSRWINKLLDRHEAAYKGEIERMHQHMNRLLEHALGPQPSSKDAPSVKQLKETADGIANGSVGKIAPSNPDNVQ